VLPLPLALIFTLFFPLVFGGIVVAVRKIALVVRPAVAVFAYPVLWTAFEFLQFLFSRDGTIGSIAYTQSDFLPLVQLAAVTGVLGLTFVASYVPAALALGLYYRRQGRRVKTVMIPALILVVGVLTYGALRLYLPNGAVSEGGDSLSSGEHFYSAGELKIGLVAISMKSYGNVYDPSTRVGLALAEQYLQEVRTLASQGARVILLPEKGIPVSDSAEAIIKGLLRDEARRSAITLTVGVTRIYKDHPECQAWVIGPDGQWLLNYRKVNLFEGEVFDGFVPGKAPGFFQQDGVINGVAICKDCDFDSYIRGYAQQGARILYVPAWDFNADGWWHSRIAMMRAVENGFTLVRNAQEGRLTISDDRGRVLSEASCEGAKRASLIGQAGSSSARTLYSRWGNWWGWINLVAAVGFLGLMAGGKRRRVNRNERLKRETARDEGRIFGAGR
jgi:apolipoprotein N-acyltransferase